MRLIKLLVNLFFKNNFFKHLRIIFNVKPVYIDTSFLGKNISVSDSFLWRCDNGYKTIFKFTDLLNFFYKIKNSKITIIFYSFNGELIKQVSFQDINLSGHLVIDQDFIDNKKFSYGTFYIFHSLNSDNEIKEIDLIIRNSCYIGFTKNYFYSYVHGNIPVIGKNLASNKLYKNFVINSIISNQKYLIQQNFSNYDYSEIFISNPTSKTIKLYLNKEKYFLRERNSILLKIRNQSFVYIVSNCYFLRPIIFNYKNNYFDVHHG
jgi:hypothetical protein